MTKAQKEAQQAAAELGAKYAITARKVIKKARALGGDTATNLKAFMTAFIDTAITPEPATTKGIDWSKMPARFRTIKPPTKSKKASK